MICTNLPKQLRSNCKSLRVGITDFQIVMSFCLQSSTDTSRCQDFQEKNRRTFGLRFSITIFLRFQDRSGFGTLSCQDVLPHPGHGEPMLMSWHLFAAVTMPGLHN